MKIKPWIIYKNGIGFSKIIAEMLQDRYAGDNRNLGRINNLELVPEERGYPVKLRISTDNFEGEIIGMYPHGEEVFGLRERDMRKMDNIRFYAILTFIIELFC